MLYPLKFKPLFFDKIWGGHKIKTELNLDFGNLSNCGEAWMVSGFDENPSIVANGFLKDNTLPELIEIYMGDLVGEKVYQRFGQLFPLLIKWIDANDDLSVQVHPDDELAKEMYGDVLGKTEMWYIKQADRNAKLICGLKDGVSKDVYEKYVADGKVLSLLKEYNVQKNDVYYIPAGTVHALRSGLLLAEIQETSDLTFRIYDWDRRDASGKEREMHKEEALRAINFSGGGRLRGGNANGENKEEGGKVRYACRENTVNSMVHSPFFQTNYLTLSAPAVRDFLDNDTFVIYICSEGSGTVRVRGRGKVGGGNTDSPIAVEIKKGEVMLIPAIFDEVYLLPDKNENLTLLETYIL